MPDAPAPSAQRTPPLNLPIAGGIPPAPVPAPVAPTPTVPEPPEYTAQIRTMAQDAGGLHIGQRPSGTMTRPGELAPALPSKPAIIAPAPEDAPSSLAHKALYGVSGIVVVGIIWAIGTSIFGNTADDIASTPTPTSTPAPTPIKTALPSRTPMGVKTLQSYLGTPTQNIDLGKGFTASTLASVPHIGGQITPVGALFNGKQADARIGLQTLFSAIPTALLDSVASEWALGVFGQTETFTPQGQTQQLSTPQGRTSIVVELANVTTATAALTSWESSSLVSNAASVLGYTPTQPALQQGSYKNITVRYQNFPTANYSVDYAIVLASNGKSYLVMTGSRQSMFAVIDQLQK